MCVCGSASRCLSFGPQFSLFFFFLFLLYNQQNIKNTRKNTYTYSKQKKKKGTSSSVVSLNRSVRIIFCFFDFSQ